MNLKKIILIITLLSMPLLQGCVATALITGATAIGMVVYDSRTSKTIIDDHNISYQAQSIINNDTQLKDHSNISAIAFNHIILLVGEAENTALKEHAKNIISGIRDIKHIHNQITIGPKVSLQTFSNDALLTTKVKAELLKENGLQTTQLKVITQNSTVYLMGIISRPEGNLAAKIAHSIAGVNKVVKVFEYA